MYPAAAADDGRTIRSAAKQTMTSPKCEYVVSTVENRRARPHDAKVNQAAIPFHNPLHDGEHLLRAGDIDDLQLGDRIERRAVVVAHMRGAVGAGFEVCRGGKEGEVEAMAFAQPTVGRIDRFLPLLGSDGNATQYLPIEERTEGAHPRVITQRSECLADQHHVGL